MVIRDLGDVILTSLTPVSLSGLQHVWIGCEPRSAKRPSRNLTSVVRGVASW